MSHKDMDYYSYIRHFFHLVAPVYDLTNIVLGRYREKVAGLVNLQPKFDSFHSLMKRMSSL